MNPLTSNFQVPTTPDEIRELAHLHCGEGLGSWEDSFHQWLSQASSEEQEIFREEVDAVTKLALVMTDPVEAPMPDFQAITEELKFPPGFFYTAKDSGTWKELPVKGARIKELSNHPDDGFTVMLLELKAGTHFPSHHHHGSEQVYLLDGDLQSDGQPLSPGDFLRAAADTHHSGLYSHGGCHALIITASQNYPKRAIHFYDRLAHTARRVKEKIFG